jgi:hypothetical protein
MADEIQVHNDGEKSQLHVQMRVRAITKLAESIAVRVVKVPPSARVWPRARVKAT